MGLINYLAKHSGSKRNQASVSAKSKLLLITVKVRNVAFCRALASLM